MNHFHHINRREQNYCRLSVMLDDRSVKTTVRGTILLAGATGSTQQPPLISIALGFGGALIFFNELTRSSIFRAVTCLK